MALPAGYQAFQAMGHGENVRHLIVGQPLGELCLAQLIATTVNVRFTMRSFPPPHSLPLSSSGEAEEGIQRPEARQVPRGRRWARLYVSNLYPFQCQATQFHYCYIHNAA